MGTQQLLLIVIGVIVVIAMVLVAYNIFYVSFSDQVKDLAIHKVTLIGSKANVYRLTSRESGGGGGSYKGFNKQLSKFLKEDHIVKKFKLIERAKKLIIKMTLQNKGKNKRFFRIWARYVPEGLERLRIYEPDSKKMGVGF